MKYYAQKLKMNIDCMKDIADEIDSTGLFDVRDHSVAHWVLKGTNYKLLVYNFSGKHSYVWVSDNKPGGERVSFDDVLLGVPPDIQRKLLFNLDLFCGKKMSPSVYYN